MKNVITSIKSSHFHLGDVKNDYGTTQATYNFDPSKASGARGSLSNELKDDLRATHYKLGYLPDAHQSTHQSSYVPLELAKKGNHDPKLRVSHIDIGGNNNNKKQNSRSIYMTDYTKKEIVD